MSALPTNPSESFRRRNPHLFPGAAGGSSAAKQPVDCLKQPRRIRQDQKPLMNKLEAEFKAYKETNLRTVFGDMVKLRPQALRFKLGNGIFYKPDFVFVRPAGRWTCYEVKGPHAFRGGFENLKVAAGLWPEIEWLLVWKAGGRWLEQAVLA